MSGCWSVSHSHRLNCAKRPIPTSCFHFLYLSSGHSFIQSNTYSFICSHSARLTYWSEIAMSAWSLKLALFRNALFIIQSLRKVSLFNVNGLWHLLSTICPYSRDHLPPLTIITKRTLFCLHLRLRLCSLRFHSSLDFHFTISVLPIPFRFDSISNTAAGLRPFGEPNLWARDIIIGKYSCRARFTAPIWWSD